MDSILNGLDLVKFLDLSSDESDCESEELIPYRKPAGNLVHEKINEAI